MRKKVLRQDERPAHRGGYDLKPEYRALAEGVSMGRLLAQRRSRKVRVLGLPDYDVNTDPPPRQR
jgi:hypothetical protein